MPYFFVLIPELKYILNRFMIYELIIRGNIQKAHEEYYKYFYLVEKLEEFSTTYMHFFILFSNIRISRKILTNNFKHMRNVFRLKTRKGFLDLFNRNETIIVRKEDGIFQYNCDISNIRNYYLFE